MTFYIERKFLRAGHVKIWGTAFQKEEICKVVFRDGRASHVAGQ